MVLNTHRLEKDRETNKCVQWFSENFLWMWHGTDFSKSEDGLHSGKRTWNTKITSLQRNIIWMKNLHDFGFHVNISWMNLQDLFVGRQLVAFRPWNLRPRKAVPPCHHSIEGKVFEGLNLSNPRLGPSVWHILHRDAYQWGWPIYKTKLDF